MSDINQLPVLLILLAFVAMIGLVTLITVFVAWRRIAGYLEQRRSERLQSMRIYHHRLTSVVSEMLKDANELDVARQYVTEKPDLAWSRKLAAACNELIALTDALKEIERLINQEKNVRGSQDSLLRALRIASGISRQLERARADLTKVEVIATTLPTAQNQKSVLLIELEGELKSTTRSLVHDETKDEGDAQHP